MLVLDTTVVNVALPSIDADLGFGPASLSWVVNAYMLAFGGLLLTGGRLGDVFGRLRVFEIGLAIFTVSSLLGGLAPTPELLIAARTSQGVGAALASPGVLALLTTSAPDEWARNRRSRCSPRSAWAAAPWACCWAASSPTSGRGAGPC